MERIRVALADDHAIVRRGVKTLLEAEPHIAVEAEVDDGLKAVEVVERLKPDVLVLDLALPSLDGLEVARRSLASSPGTKIVILSMYDDMSHINQAFRAGAKAYVLKRSAPEELVRAIHEVREGNSYVSPPLSLDQVESYAETSEDIEQDVYETLTSRQREVLQLAAQGCNRVEIAARLGISLRTAESHRANLMRKLSLRNQTDLVRYAVRRGILPA